MEVTRSKSRDSLLGASGMSCLPCNSAPLCNCTASQTCAATVRTCTECSVAFCQDKVALPAPPSTLGSTIGAALGGVLAIVAGIGLVYWFWWKPRGLAASRQRYSRHLSQRQSKLSMGGIEKRGLGGAQGSVSKRSSVHLRMDGGEESLNRRNTGVSPYLDDGGLSSAGATGDRTADSVDVDSLLDNPFDDDASVQGLSARASDFSFCSSASTNIIPIAYIPPHSSSLSMADAERGPFGEVDGGRKSFLGPRESIPSSLTSRDSLGNGMDNVVEIAALSPIASAESPRQAYRISTSGAPIRPPRSPGLDLQLPTPSPQSTPVGSPPGEHQRPLSGFPWSGRPPPARPGLKSNFSSATTSDRSSSYLTSNGTGDRGLSTLLERNQSHLSVMSNASSGTSRSGNSTMSYILDPPQIITPVNAQGLRRVEVMGRGTAGLVTLQGRDGASTSSTPSTPVPAADNPFSDDASIRPTSSLQRPGSQTIVDQPFNTNQSRWTNSTQGTEFGNSRTSLVPSFLISDGDMPLSARNSGLTETGDTARPLTGGMGPTTGGRRDSRMSVASSTAHSVASDSLSMLDGIPFIASPQPPSAATSTDSLSQSQPSSSTSSFRPVAPPLSPLFPKPPTRPASLDRPPPPVTPPTGDLLEDDLSPLPTPFMPFAGQRPTSSSTAGATGARVNSSDMSIRSGFGSGLDDIPFQLGFSGRMGMDGSERGSIMTVDTLGRERSTRASMASLDDRSETDHERPGRQGTLSQLSLALSDDASFVTAYQAKDSTPALRNRASATPLAGASTLATVHDLLDPFGPAAEVVDSRASTSSIDTLALSAELARTLAGED